MVDTFAGLGYSQRGWGTEARRLDPAGGEHTHPVFDPGASIAGFCRSPSACSPMSSVEASGDQGLVAADGDKVAIGKL